MSISPDPAVTSKQPRRAGHEALLYPASFRGADIIELGKYHKTYRVAQAITRIEMGVGTTLIRFADGQVCHGWQDAADRGLLVPVCVTGRIFEDLPIPAGDLDCMYETREATCG